MRGLRTLSRTFKALYTPFKGPCYNMLPEYFGPRNRVSLRLQNFGIRFTVLGEDSGQDIQKQTTLEAQFEGSRA